MTTPRLKVRDPRHLLDLQASSSTTCTTASSSSPTMTNTVGGHSIKPAKPEFNPPQLLSTPSEVKAQQRDSEPVPKKRRLLEATVGNPAHQDIGREAGKEITPLSDSEDILAKVCSAVGIDNDLVESVVEDPPVSHQPQAPTSPSFPRGPQPLLPGLTLPPRVRPPDLHLHPGLHPAYRTSLDGPYPMGEVRYPYHQYPPRPVDHTLLVPRRVALQTREPHYRPLIQYSPRYQYIRPALPGSHISDRSHLLPPHSSSPTMPRHYTTPALHPSPPGLPVHHLDPRLSPSGPRTISPTTDVAYPSPIDHSGPHPSPVPNSGPPTSSGQQIPGGVAGLGFKGSSTQVKGKGESHLLPPSCPPLQHLHSASTPFPHPHYSPLHPRISETYVRLPHNLHKTTLHEAGDHLSPDTSHTPPDDVNHAILPPRMAYALEPLPVQNCSWGIAHGDKRIQAGERVHVRRVMEPPTPHVELIPLGPPPAREPRTGGDDQPGATPVATQGPPHHAALTPITSQSVPISSKEGLSLAVAGGPPLAHLTNTGRTAISQSVKQQTRPSTEDREGRASSPGSKGKMQEAVSSEGSCRRVGHYEGSMEGGGRMGTGHQQRLQISTHAIQYRPASEPTMTGPQLSSLAPAQRPASLPTACHLGEFGMREDEAFMERLQLVLDDLVSVPEATKLKRLSCHPAQLLAALVQRSGSQPSTHPNPSQRIRQDFKAMVRLCLPAALLQDWGWDACTPDSILQQLITLSNHGECSSRSSSTPLIQDLEDDVFSPPPCSTNSIPPHSTSSQHTPHSTSSHHIPHSTHLHTISSHRTPHTTPSPNAPHSTASHHTPCITSLHQVPHTHANIMMPQTMPLQTSPSKSSAHLQLVMPQTMPLPTSLSKTSARLQAYITSPEYSSANLTPHVSRLPHISPTHHLSPHSTSQHSPSRATSQNHPPTYVTSQHHPLHLVTSQHLPPPHITSHHPPPYAVSHHPPPHIISRHPPHHITSQLIPLHHATSRHPPPHATSRHPSPQATSHHPPPHVTSHHPPPHAASHHPPPHAASHHPPSHATSHHPPLHVTPQHHPLHTASHHPPPHAASHHPPPHVTPQHPPLHATPHHPPPYVTPQHPPLHATSHHPPPHVTSHHPPPHVTPQHPSPHATPQHPPPHTTAYHPPPHVTPQHPSPHATPQHPPPHATSHHPPPHATPQHPPPTYSLSQSLPSAPLASPSHHPPPPLHTTMPHHVGPSKISYTAPPSRTLRSKDSFATRPLLSTQPHHSPPSHRKSHPPPPTTTTSAKGLHHGRHTSLPHHTSDTWQGGDGEGVARTIIHTAARNGQVSPT